MGLRKQKSAKKIKEVNKTKYFAKYNNCPTSPRKMRLVADLIRGMEVANANAILKFTKKEASIKMGKLLKSAISNYENKTGLDFENGNLFIKEVFVDSAKMLKRIQPAPQGRFNRIRKRSNHITIILATKEIIKKLEKKEEE